jgi:aminoglycoside 6'-N-acetyltransferase I
MQNPVVSTEAGHAFVSSEPEKSASLYMLSSQHWFAHKNRLHPSRGVNIDDQNQTGKPFRQKSAHKNARAALARGFDRRASQGTRVVSPLRMYGTLPMAILVSHDKSSELNGFVKIGLRSHADSCDPARPVGFVEGWFVHEASREQGIGSALMRSAEAWARTQGCREMASDTWIDDERSIRSHQALGFEIVDRYVHFPKAL